MESSLITHQRIRIQENTFAVLSQIPAVDLGEGDTKLRTSQHGQTKLVLTVLHIYCDDLIKYVFKDFSGERDLNKSE